MMQRARKVLIAIVQAGAVAVATRHGRKERESHAKLCRGALAYCAPCRRMTSAEVTAGHASVMVACNAAWFRTMADAAFAAYLAEAFKRD